MLWLVIYCLLSIVIARWLEKRMKVAAIFHSIMFTIMLSYLLILSDVRFLNNILSGLFGEDAYNSFKDALFYRYRLYSSELSVFLIIEGILLIMSIVVIVYAAYKIVKKIISIFKKDVKVFKDKVLCCKYILVEWRSAFKIYLKFCRLLN